jgi:predicted ester cyclase
LKARTAVSSLDAQELEKNKELVRQYFDLINEQEIGKMQELISPKHRFCFPDKPPLHWNGHRQLLSLVYFTAFPDFGLDIEERIAGGNKVIVRMRCTGTHKADFQGTPPTGKSKPM